MAIQGAGAAASKATRQDVLSGYVYNSGIHKPEQSEILSWKYPQYYLTALLDRLGSYGPVAQSQWTWFEQDRTRKAGTVSAFATGVATLSNITSADGYFVPGDVVRDAKDGKVYKVTATGDSSGNLTVTLTDMDGAAATAVSTSSQ